MQLAVPGPDLIDDASPSRIDAAARIWAEACAARDGHPDVPRFELARSDIADAINSGGMLLSVVDARGVSMGFAAIAPRGDEQAELSYLAVRPTAWSQGIGARLLAEAVIAMRSGAYGTAELWVYADNEPARAIYTRGGWAQDGVMRSSRRTGKVQHRYVLDL